jgi:signal peptidase I
VTYRDLVTRSGRSPGPAEGPLPWGEPWPADEASADDPADPAVRGRLANGFPDYGADPAGRGGFRPVNGHNGDNGYGGPHGSNGAGAAGAGRYADYPGYPDQAADRAPYNAYPGQAADRAQRNGYPGSDAAPHNGYPDHAADRGPGNGYPGSDPDGAQRNGYHGGHRRVEPPPAPGYDADSWAGHPPGWSGAGYPAEHQPGPYQPEHDGWAGPANGRVSPAYSPYPDPPASPPTTGAVPALPALPAHPEQPPPGLPAYPVQPELPRARRAQVDPLANHPQPIYPADPAESPVRPQQQPYADEATEVLRRYVPANELLSREPVTPGTRKHPTRAVARRRARRRRALEWPFLVAFALVAAFLIRAFAVQTFYIPSGSMHETLVEGDRVLVNKLGYHLHAPNRGDVVVFRRPPDFEVSDDDLIKRVVALPGETVSGKGRKVLVNGKALVEPYVEPTCNGTEDFAPVKVPAGHLWVMGDNRCDSSDSRVFGPIDESLLVGRAFVLVWPTDRIAWL